MNAHINMPMDKLDENLGQFGQTVRDRNGLFDENVSINNPVREQKKGENKFRVFSKFSELKNTSGGLNGNIRHHL